MWTSKTAEPIRTARLQLRPAVPADLPAFHAIMRHPDAMRHWSTLPHADLGVTKVWMEPLFTPPGQGFEMVIERDGHLIGKAGGYSLPEVGFILHPDHWGQGYATEAMQALIPVLFACSDVPALTADVDPLNPASLRVLAKLGFVETHRAERTFNLGGVWADSVYLALPRPGLAMPAAPE